MAQDGAQGRCQQGVLVCHIRTWLTAIASQTMKPGFGFCQPYQVREVIFCVCVLTDGVTW